MLHLFFETLNFKSMSFVVCLVFANRVRLEPKGFPVLPNFFPYTVGKDESGNTKGGSITVRLTSRLTGLD